MGKDRRRQRVTLRYPKHALTPEDLLHFIESTVFTKRWEQLGLDDEEDLSALQLFIMSSPAGHPIIKGTGGLRKLRFVPPEAKIGKSGGFRVCYVYFEEYGIVYLVYVYTKHEKDELDAGERNAIRDYIRREKLALDRLKTIV
jgi:hypothetical protein